MILSFFFADIQIPVYPQGNKVFLPSETETFIRLLKYGEYSMINVNLQGIVPDCGSLFSETSQTNRSFLH